VGQQRGRGDIFVFGADLGDRWCQSAAAPLPCQCARTGLFSPCVGGSDVKLSKRSADAAQVQGKGGHQKRTDHSTASRRQQAHTRRRIPTALPRTYGRDWIT
jgi:hypothetical protein